ncbi:hypothetical protein U0070_023506, partial [Myodes glareolus]
MGNPGDRFECNKSSQYLEGPLKNPRPYFDFATCTVPFLMIPFRIFISGMGHNPQHNSSGLQKEKKKPEFIVLGDTNEDTGKGAGAKLLHPAWEPGSTAFLHRVEEKRQNKPSLEHLPPIQVYSVSCFKRRHGHEVTIYLFAAAGLL